MQVWLNKIWIQFRCEIGFGWRAEVGGRTWWWIYWFESARHVVWINLKVGQAFDRSGEINIWDRRMHCWRQFCPICAKNLSYLCKGSALFVQRIWGKLPSIEPENINFPSNSNTNAVRCTDTKNNTSIKL